LELRKDGICGHFSDAWNVMDLFMYLLIVAVLGIHFMAE